MLIASYNGLARRRYILHIVNVALPDSDVYKRYLNCTVYKTTHSSNKLMDPHNSGNHDKGDIHKGRYLIF